MSDATPASGGIRVSPAPTSRVEGDASRDIDPATAPLVEPRGPGRAVLHGDRDVLALVGTDHRATSARPRTIEIVVDGWRFELEVEPVRTAELRARATQARSAVGDAGPLEIRAMIPGRIVAVAVAVGDAVTAGQTILVIEAMKMQNDVRAPRDGRVERLAVGAGETIDLGQLLASLA